jgi:hypothetical protein
MSNRKSQPRFVFIDDNQVENVFRRMSIDQSEQGPILSFDNLAAALEYLQSCHEADSGEPFPKRIELHLGPHQAKLDFVSAYVLRFAKHYPQTVLRIRA